MHLFDTDLVTCHFLGKRSFAIFWCDGLYWLLIMDARWMVGMDQVIPSDVKMRSAPNWDSDTRYYVEILSVFIRSSILA